ncbi:MAG: aldo/keto reductase [Planctomycetes bacterium]|nr:aldo/keto reductase [Phycisphaerae bacterium]NBB94551.1 aldo/keto reductase [Planctomycetota bacterium]
MQYRTLGRTGLEVSQLGFGAMRLPMTTVGETNVVDRDKAVPMIHRAFEAGVNYIDTATFYCDQDSQRAVGDALKGWRETIVVSTKNPYYDEDESAWWQNLDDSLERLDIEYIDVYNHHGMNWKHYTDDVEPRVSKWMQKALDQGLIKHICCSFHGSPDGLVNIIKTGYPAVITVQYNMLDRQLEDAIALAHESHIGVVIMGPVAGGKLGGDSPVIADMVEGVDRVPELAMRFVLSNPNVTVALSGMSTMEQVEENIATCSDEVTLSGDDKAAIDEHLKRLKNMAATYCTSCKYCMPCALGEDDGVNIPHVFGLYNRGKVYGLWDSARKAYAQINDTKWIKGRDAAACTDCGVCEPKCPQNIPIRKQLKEAHEVLTSDDS